MNTDSAVSATLVIGAGELGLAMLRGLSPQQGAARRGALSVLLRPAAAHHAAPAREALARTLPADGISVVHADLAKDSEEALASLFAGFQTVICCTGFVGGAGTQRKITAAVLRAGVERYVPWQFGVDYDAVGRGSGQDVWDEQLDVRDMLRAQSLTYWTIVSTGIFTSFLFEPAFGLVNFDQSQVTALGDWDYRLTVTTPDDIGHLTAAILARVGSTENAIVFVAGDTLSYAQLATLVEQQLGHPVERRLQTADNLRLEAADHPGDVMRKYRLALARPDGVAWDKEYTFNATHGIPVTDVATWLAQNAPIDRRRRDG